MFEFVVKYWEGEDREINECRGFVGAGSYAIAMDKVIDHYSIPGKFGENIISVYISELEDPFEWEEIKNWLVKKAGEWK